MAFFADRLKVQLREQGARHDLVDAVFALEGQDDLVLIVRRVEALGTFLDTEDGKNLLAGYKRAANILRIEEKRDSATYDGLPDEKLYQLPEEIALARAITITKDEAGRAVAAEDFAAAMRAMAELRPHVDAFFDKVTVNVDDPALRANRLKLLNEIRAATRTVADFSRNRGLAAHQATGTRGKRWSFAYISEGDCIMFSISHISPIVALIAGILILIFPQALNYIVAIYLIIVGITGLGIIH